MAKFYAGIVTDATGEQRIDFSIPEGSSQLIFKYLLGTAASITRQDKNGLAYQDTRKLGECLIDYITGVILKVESAAIQYEKDQIVAEARKSASELKSESQIRVEK